MEKGSACNTFVLYGGGAMSEHELLKKCAEAFPGIDKNEERDYSIADLLSTRSNPDLMQKQKEVADHLGFPNSEDIIQRSFIARTCVEKQDAIIDKLPVEKLVERFENKIAEARLIGSDERGVQLFPIGKGEFSWRGRITEPVPPEMTERQKEVFHALRKNPKIQVDVAPYAGAMFWVRGR